MESTLLLIYFMNIVNTEYYERSTHFSENIYIHRFCVGKVLIF